MKSYILEPTYENIFESLKNDTIGRNLDVIDFTKLIVAIGGGKSVSVDAEWGSGKTFFIKQSQMLLDAFNNYGIEGISHGLVNEEDAVVVKNILHNAYPECNFDPYVTVYYDAWINDSDDDPILSILYSIMTSSLVDRSDVKFIERIKCIGNILVSVAESIKGLPVSSVVTKVKELINAEEKLVKDIYPRKRLLDEINAFFDTVLVGEEKGIIIYIDELDRCRPLYAVQLLERIKHYFCNDKLTFIFSVNKNELQHTIKCIYGEGFNASQYLNRFFDYNLTLPECNRDKFFKTIDIKDESHYYDILIKDVSDYFNFSLRDTIRFQDLSLVALGEFKKISYGTSNWSLNQLMRCCYLFVPILIGLKLSSVTDYKSLVKGENVELFKKLVHYKAIKSIYSRYFSNSFDEMDETQFNEMVEQLYRVAFVKGYKDGYFERKIGNLSVSSSNIKEMLRIASLISRFCNAK